MTTPPAGFLGLPDFGNVKDDLTKAIDAIKVLDGWLNGPLGFLVPGQIKTAVDELSKLLAGAEALLNITP